MNSNVKPVSVVSVSGSCSSLSGPPSAPLATGCRHWANSRKISGASRLKRSLGSDPAGSNTREILKRSPACSTTLPTASSPARSASKQSLSSRTDDPRKKRSRSSLKPAVP